MREFTKEEKDLIVNTPISNKCFDMDEFENLEANFLVQDNGSDDTEGVWYELTENLEELRQEYIRKKDERYFNELVRLLPNTYKVVKL